MMPHSNETIAALIGSRICHDLISPIGAVNNGLELLALSGVPDGPEMTLLHDSAVSANGRIMLFRLAFGLASKDQATAADELCRAWQAGQSGKPIRLVWAGPDSLPRREAQLLLLGCLCAETALTHGGTIEVRRSDGDWQLDLAGSPLVYDPAPWGCLSGGPLPDGLNPALVQFALLPRLLTEMGRQARVERGHNRLTMAF